MNQTSHQITFDLTMDAQGRKVVRAIGDLDLVTAPLLKSQVLAAAEPGETLVIDLEEVVFIDSPGLGTLIYCDRQQRDAGGHLVLANPSGPVQDLFRLVRLADVLEIE